MIAKLLQTEPARLISVIAAVMGLAIGYGLMSQAKADMWIAALTVALPVVLPLIQGALTRETVYAPANVQKIADAATNLPAGTPVDIGVPPEGGQG